MKGVSLFVAVLMFAQALAADKELISLQTTSEDSIELKCTGNWDAETVADRDTRDTNKTLNRNFDVDRSQFYTCKDGDKEAKVYVKIRTFTNLIEVDVLTLGLIVLGNLIMYVLLGVVVYKLSSQPRAQRTFSGNKASDKQVLIPNGERDTYQQLNQTQKSEYSALGVGKRR